MIAAWMLFAVLTGAALSGAAAAAERLAAAARLPRRFVWLVALVATVVWPLVMWLRPGNGVAPDAPFATALTGPAVQRLTAFVVSAQGDASARHADVVLLAAWGAGAAVCVARLLLGLCLLGRCRRAWPVADVDGVPVRTSADVGPAVVGVRAMEVVLPAWALALDRPLRALVLRHEEEHRAARDPHLLLAASVLTALVPWHLAVWWQARRLRLAVEVDCDARVLRAEPHPARYARLLLTIAERRRAPAPRLAPGLLGVPAPPSHLDRRITAMRTTASPVSRRRAAAAALASASIAVAAVAVACSVESPERSTAPAGQPTAQRAATPKRVSDSAGFFEFQVERPAAMRSGAGPVYPAALRAAGVRGEVQAQFVVDTTGRVDMSTFKAIRSSDPRLTAAVEAAVRGWQFAPAEVGGHKVKQLVQQPFEFAAPR